MAATQGPMFLSPSSQCACNRGASAQKPSPCAGALFVKGVPFLPLEASPRTTARSRSYSLHSSLSLVIKHTSREPLFRRTQCHGPGHWSCSSGLRKSSLLSTAKRGPAVRRVSQSCAGEPLRAVVILPGLGNNTGDYDALKLSLEQQGFPCTVAQVSRADWLRNAAGLLDANYWRGTLKPRPVLDWYLQRVEEALKTAQSGVGVPLCLLGHSAGGWLARLYMAEFGFQGISLLLTLGTPHLPPPRGVPGVVDQTRGLLYHLEEACPGAFHAPHVDYVCVSGRYLKGSPLVGAGGEGEEGGVDFEDRLAVAVARTSATLTPSEPEAAVAAFVNPPAASGFSSSEESEPEGKPRRPSLQARIVGQGYKQVCGQAAVWGDGVVPEPSALLPGAKHVILRGVYHSPVGASEARPWYGSESVLPQWVQYLYL